MNFIKRSFLSIKTRIGKSILQLVVFTVIFLLIISGLGIQSASKAGSELARKSIGGDVSLTFNNEKVFEKFQNGDISHEEFHNVRFPQVPIEDVKKLADSSYIKGYEVYTGAEVSVKDKQFEQVVSEENRPDDVGMFTSHGVLNSENHASFKASDPFIESNLIEGRHITEDDLDKNVVMIEKELAEKNNLKVGDTIKLSSNENVDIELEIVGIFEGKTLNAQVVNMVPSMHPTNTIYMPYTVANKFMKVANDKVELATLFVEDPMEIDNFTSWATDELAGIKNEEFILDANSQMFDQMAGPLESLGSISKAIVYLVTLAGAIILALIIMMSIRERKYEIGVLLAIGEKKWKIIGQFLGELLIVMTVAFGISAASGNLVANQIGSQLLENQIQSTQNDGGMMGGFSFFSREVDTIDEIEIDIMVQDLVRLASLGVFIATVSTLVPSLSILQLQPKNILLKQD